MSETKAPLLRAIDEALDRARARQLVSPEALEKFLVELRKLAVDTVKSKEETEREIKSLTNLYTVHARLLDDPRPEKVCEAVEEIVVNLIGSEDFALYVRKDKQFSPQRGLGEAYKGAHPFEYGKGHFGQLAAGSEPKYAEPGWVLLTSLVTPTSTAVGFLAVKTLVRHKPRLTFEDREMVAVLRTRAGAALSAALGSR